MSFNIGNFLTPSKKRPQTAEHISVTPERAAPASTEDADQSPGEVIASKDSEKSARSPKEPVSFPDPLSLATAIGTNIAELSDNLGKAAKAGVDEMGKAAVAAGKGIDAVSKVTGDEVGKAAAAAGKTVDAISKATVESISKLARPALPAAAPADEEVDERTPAERWFTPQSGWLASGNAECGAPPNLMPIHPSLIPDEASVVGELELEVLEAERLPQKDLSGYTDACTVRTARVDGCDPHLTG